MNELPPPPDPLLERIIAGARAGSLVLTPSEYGRLRVNAGPQAAVVVNGNPVLVWSLPLHVIPDSIDDIAVIPDHPTSPMHWQLLASYHDDLLDLDDLARLWHHPAETDYLEPPVLMTHLDDPPIDVAHAALLEAGRPDLASLLVWHYDDETDTVGFLDLLDDETDDGNPITRPDWDLVDRAEDIARASIGLPPMEREP